MYTTNTIKDLIENLEEKVFNLGINPKFRENPAYSMMIAKMTNEIQQIVSINEKFENIGVDYSNENCISFKIRTNPKRKYEFDIIKVSPSEFIFSSYEKNNYDEKNITGHEITAYRDIVSISDNGNMKHDTTSVSVNDFGCDNSKGEMHNFISSIKSENYSPEGIMTRLERKSFPAMKTMSSDFWEDRWGTDFNKMALFQGPGNRYHDMESNMYTSHTVLEREKLDTAILWQNDKASGSKFVSVVPLNTENGLRDMKLPGPVTMNSEIFIPPLSQEKIDAMIEKENNPKVKDGLRKLAVGRDTYCYDSTKDPMFVREGYESSESKSI